MEDIETIGGQLRRERERRGLSLREVQDATKITVNNLSALEEDRFDEFPNRVYTRAFLRDYANYLALDSAGLLESYERTCAAKSDLVTAAPARRKSRLKVVWGVVVTLIVLGAVAAAAYIWWTGCGLQGRLTKPVSRLAPGGAPSGTATLPNPPVAPIGPPQPPPVPPPTPVKPDVMTLEAAATHVVWIRVWADGKQQPDVTMKPGDVKCWQARKIIKIRAGKAGAVQLKWNGVTQPPLGPLGAPGDGKFLYENAPVPPAAPVNPTPAQPAPPANPPSGPIGPPGGPR